MGILLAKDYCYLLVVIMLHAYVCLSFWTFYDSSYIFFVVYFSILYSALFLEKKGLYI